MQKNLADAIEQAPSDFKYMYYIQKSKDIFFKAPWLFVGGLLANMFISGFISIIIPIIGSIASSIFSAMFTGGYYIIAKKILENKPVDFNDFFEPFKKFEKLLPIILVESILIILATCLFIIPGIYLIVAYSLVMPIALFCNEDLWNTLEASRKIVTKQWFSFLGFILLLLLLNLAGFICLGIGLLVTIPISIISFYVIFDDLVKSATDEFSSTHSDLLDEGI